MTARVEALTFAVSYAQPRPGAGGGVVATRYALPVGGRRRPLERCEFRDGSASGWSDAHVGGMSAAAFRAWRDRCGERASAVSAITLHRVEAWA